MAKKKNMYGLTDDQFDVFRSFTTGANIFLTGKGGTGKSYLTSCIIDWCSKKGKSVLVCAPTGIAARIIGGETIHRAFHAGVSLDEIIGKRCYNKRAIEKLSKADVIIIDEISMCRIDLFEYVARTLLYLQPHKQLLVVGDFYQLAPVPERETTGKETFAHYYGNRLYAFESEFWAKLNLTTMELQTSMRQSDTKFITALDNIRNGVSDFDVFKPRLTNQADPTAISICGKNSEADEENQRHLALLKKDAKMFTFVAEVTGDIVHQEYPTDEKLTLCVGARIIMLNNDTNKRWVNGSFATITAIDNDAQALTIRTDEGATATVTRAKTDFTGYRLEKAADGTSRLVAYNRGTFSQFPVRLGWAVSIHKSQGQTYERVNIDLRSIFAAGQLYVALSRCKSLDGIRILGSLNESKVIVSDAVIKFMSGDHRPYLEGPTLPFAEEPVDDRWQEGYDEGYEDGTEDTERRYQEMVDADKSVKRLSKYTTRQKELAEIEDPELRNPKHAGRPKKPYTEKAQSKAIRIVGSIVEQVKAINDYIRENPDEESRVQSLLANLLQQLQ